ncbi:hypothetical protein HYW21_04395 [Candidatus Woesearchaeota archaeon]|nr:hypothetical protein [Candidatus Woesearchaeota archaeon]
MIYTVALSILDAPPELRDLLRIDHQKAERSEIKILQQKKGLLLRITAQDAVALRATMNTITQLLSVHEKLQRVENGCI